MFSALCDAGHDSADARHGTDFFLLAVWDMPSFPFCILRDRHLSEREHPTLLRYWRWRYLRTSHLLGAIEQFNLCQLPSILRLMLGVALPLHVVSLGYVREVHLASFSSTSVMTAVLSSHVPHSLHTWCEQQSFFEAGCRVSDYEGG